MGLLALFYVDTAYLRKPVVALCLVVAVAALIIALIKQDDEREDQRSG